MKNNDITQAIINNLIHRCGCVLNTESQDIIIQNSYFDCFSSEAVTYRAELHGTRETTAAELLQHIQQWVKDGASIFLQSRRLSADPDCEVNISSFDEPGCQGDQTIVLVAGVSAGVLFLVIIISLLAVIVVCRKRHITKGREYEVSIAR